MLKTAKHNLGELQSGNTLPNDFGNAIGAFFDPIFILYRIVKVVILKKFLSDKNLHFNSRKKYLTNNPNLT